MGGPGADVLLPFPIGEREIADLHFLFEQVRSHGSPERLGRFWVSDTRYAGGTYHATSPGGMSPFGIFYGEDEWHENLEHSFDIVRFRDYFGFEPRDAIGILAFCNGDADHQVLGELCLWVAERFGGIVDFGGRLEPPLPPDAEIDWRDPARPSYLDALSREMVAGLPGRLLEITSAGNRISTHLGDATFLRAWLRHPNFVMVK